MKKLKFDLQRHEEEGSQKAPTRAQIFGRNLKRIQKEKGYTRKQLADFLGVTDKTIGNYISGDKEPSFKKLFALANFLEVSVLDLLGNNGYSPKNVDVSEEIFNYRLQRAITMAQNYLDSIFNSNLGKENKDGKYLVFTPVNVKYEEGNLIFIGDGDGNIGNTILFKNKEDFVKTMEQAEKDALYYQVSFCKAFRRIVFKDEN